MKGLKQIPSTGYICVFSPGLSTVVIVFTLTYPAIVLPIELFTIPNKEKDT